MPPKNSFLGDLALNAASPVVNGALSFLGMNVQKSAEKDMMKWQYDNFLSPRKQVSNLAAAGINPAAAMGNSAPILNSAPSAAGLQAPQFGIGTTSLSDLASYITAKSGQKQSEADIRLKEAETRAKQLENELTQVFGSPKAAAEVALAWKNVRLSDDTHDLNLQQKAINEYRQVTEKALSETSEHNRDMAKKRLDNLDTELKLENALKREEAKTERSKQSANLAAAAASNTQADLNRENRRLQAALADVEEAGKLDKINSLIAEYRKNGSLSAADAKEADIRLSRLSDVEDKRNSRFFREVDGFLEWLKDKVSIFKTK